MITAEQAAQEQSSQSYVDDDRRCLLAHNFALMNVPAARVWMQQEQQARRARQELAGRCDIQSGLSNTFADVPYNQHVLRRMFMRINITILTCVTASVMPVQLLVQCLCVSWCNACETASVMLV